MSATGLEIFDRTLQTTNAWLGELMQFGPDRHVARHGGEPGKWRPVEELSMLPPAGLQPQRPVDPVHAMRAAFRVLNHHIDPDQAENVRQALPAEAATPAKRAATA